MPSRMSITFFFIFHNPAAQMTCQVLSLCFENQVFLTIFSTLDSCSSLMKLNVFFNYGLSYKGTPPPCSCTQVSMSCTGFHIIIIYFESSLFCLYTRQFHWKRVETMFSVVPLAYRTPLHLIQEGSNSWSDVGGCFLFCRTNSDQLQNSTFLNHRLRCSGWIACGHCWLGSIPSIFAFYLIVHVLLCGILPTA